MINPKLTDDEREALYGDALGLDNLHAAWGRETLESAVERILADRVERLTSERDMALRMHAVQFARANFRAEDLQRLRDGLSALADEFASEVDWSSGRWDYGDNAAWERASRAIRALLDGAQ